MKFTNSLRYKLSIIYLYCIVIPVLVLSFIMPSYYQKFMEKKIKVLTSSTLTSMSRNISTYLDDLEGLTLVPYLNNDIMSAIKLKAMGKYENANDYSKLSADRALFGTLPNFLQNTRNDILGFVLYTYDDYLLAAWKNDLTSTVKNYQMDQSGWFSEVVKADGRVVYIGLHKADYFSSPNVQMVFSIARLIKDPDSQKPLGVIMADADKSIFQKMVSEINFDVSSIVTIMDQNGAILYSNHILSENEKEQIRNNSSIVKGEKDSYILVSKVIAPANWKIIVLTSYSEFTSRTKYMYLIGIIFAIGGLIITFLLFFLLSYKIVNPFKKMIAVMKQVEQGNMHVQYTPQGNDEIAQLGVALNHMIFKIDDLINREYRAILNQRNAEYHALQSQIQPHFMYNTLNGFIGLNRMGDSKKLEKAILNLTGMLRYILEHDDFSLVSEEFLFLERYCGLQKLRFDDRMDFEIHYDMEIADCKIPKLLLQPIAENGIIHGIEPLDKHGLIKIRGELLKSPEISTIKFSIQDNGVGFDTNTKFMKPNVGLSNVEARLAMTYKKSRIYLESTVGFGTIVTIEIDYEEVKK